MNEPFTILSPWRGEARISQTFGGNPKFYGRFTYGGVSLKGHNGIDIALVEWTRLHAPLDGMVTGRGFEAGGFGNWLKLRHGPAGMETVYGHLAEINVVSGQEVGAGELIGLSGNTGGSSGPHLHFGLRAVPFNRGDGWGGCVDPAPFLPIEAIAQTRAIAEMEPSDMVNESVV